MLIRRMPTPGDGLRAIARNGFLLSGAMWIETAIRFGYILAIIHYLGAEGYGIWAYAAAAYVLGLGISGFGLEALIPVRLGASHDGRRSYLGTTLTIRLAFAVLASLGLGLYALFAEPDPLLSAALLLVLPALLGRSLALWAYVSFIGLERPGRYVQVSLALRVGEMVTGVFLLSRGGSVLDISALHSLTWLIEAVAGYLMVRRQLGTIRPRFALRELLDLIRGGAPIGATALLNAAITSSPLLMFRHTEGTSLVEVGQFAAALQIGVILAASVQPFFLAALPALSRSIERGDSRAQRYGLVSGLLTMGTFGLAAALGFIAGPVILPWLFGAEFRLAGELLGLCIIIGALMNAPTGYAHMLIAQGRQGVAVMASLAAALCLFLTFAFAVRALGVWGAGLSLALSWLIRASILAGTASIVSPGAGKSQQPGPR